MGEILIYRSNYQYEKLTQNELSLEVGDIIEVKKPFQFPFEGTETNLKGWVLGRNLRSGESGYFPGQFVAFLRSESIAYPTSIPPRPVPRPQVLPRVPGLLPPAELQDSGYGESPSKFTPDFYSFCRRQYRMKFLQINSLEDGKSGFI